jgi:hypothetical protein
MKQPLVLFSLFLMGPCASSAVAESTGGFAAIGNMTIARAGHSATLLSNGKVLIVGGYGDSFRLASAELYDPSTGTFTRTGDMTGARAEHSAALLPNGKVLIAGGYVDRPLRAELYDPSTGVFTATGDMIADVGTATAALLLDGRVLVAGDDSVQIYSPATGTFAMAGGYADSSSINVATATLLLDGRVLLTGFYDNFHAGWTALYDPGARTFSLANTLPSWGNVNTAVRLQNGKVLFVGNDDDGFPAYAELYDPSTGTFTNGSTIWPHERATSTLLPDGRILIAGSVTVGGYFDARTELYDPVTAKFSAGSNMITARFGQTATLLPDGSVLMTGGYTTAIPANFGVVEKPGSSAELYLSSLPPAQAKSATPVAGSGTAQTFTFTFTDPTGYQSLTVVDILIRDVLDGRQACYVAFVPSGMNSGSVYLVDDAGDAGGPYSGMLLPGSSMVYNDQCSITGAGSSVSASGNNLALTLAYTFAPGFAGNKVVYLAARDSGWQPLATWNVPGAVFTGPAVTGVAPARSSGFNQTYIFSFTDSHGWQDIRVANVLINNAINGGAACYMAYVPTGAGSGIVYLVDNAGDAGGPYLTMAIPGSGVVSNGQCTIAGTGSSVSASGNNLALVLAITFSPGFAGNRIVYLAVRNNTLNSGWQAVGTAGVQ